jgi:hypothetical protein
MKETINLQISIDEANLILEALGNLPFARVYALIGKIQEQAGQQLSAEGPPAETDGADYPAPTISE